MKKSICQKCGATILFDDQREFFICQNCGTKYRVKVKGVREIPTTEGRYAGQAFVRSFVPEGWTTATNAPELESNLLSPLPMQVNFTSPKADAFITFTGTRQFSHIDNTPENAPRQGQMILPDRIVGWSYMDAEYICNQMLSVNPVISDVRILSETDQPDHWALSHLQKVVRNSANAGTLNPGGNWVKKYATCKDANGNTWHKLVEVMVIYCYLPITQTEQMMYQLALESQQRKMALINMMASRGYVAGMMAGMQTPPVQPPQPKLRWALEYMIETSARDEIFREAAAYHDKIRSAIELTALHKREAAQVENALYQKRQQEERAINEAMGEINRQRSESWDRQRKMVQETNEYTTNLMRKAQRNASETNHRVNNRWSEVIRGVNTYYTKHPGFGEPKVVEVSNQLDHVYQSNRDPSVYAASNSPWGLGPDFDELEPTNGDY